jgi:3',5'-cyclic AMP phosphodiesterase CpdA
MRSLIDLLVLTDLHYIRAADDVCEIEERRCYLGPALIREAARDVREMGVEPDALILLGDLVNDGLAPGADRDLAEIVQAARETGLPVLAVPGNHDGDVAPFVAAFDCPPGLHVLGGYGFLIFHDHVASDDVTTRPEGGLALPLQVARDHPGLPLVVLQHNPLHPQIEHEYPFMLTNADRILQAYREAAVILSLSGHYHPGQAAHVLDGTVYATLPAACEAPFRYAHVHMEGRAAAVRLYALAGKRAGAASVKF